jgi:hypothetical protein
MRAVLDTSVVIATDVPPLLGELAISSATVAELHFGVLVAGNASRRAESLRRLSALQRDFDPLPVDDAVVVSHGQLAAAVVAIGRQPRAAQWIYSSQQPHTRMTLVSTPVTLVILSGSKS